VLEDSSATLSPTCRPSSQSRGDAVGDLVEVAVRDPCATRLNHRDCIRDLTGVLIEVCGHGNAFRSPQKLRSLRSYCSSEAATELLDRCTAELRWLDFEVPRR